MGSNRNVPRPGRTASTGLAVLAVLAAGCVASPVEADANVRIGGRVQRDDGAAAPDAVGDLR